MLAALACATGAKAQDLTDSLHVHQLQTVVVKAVRASKDAPFAVSNGARTAWEQERHTCAYVAQQEAA